MCVCVCVTYCVCVCSGVATPGPTRAQALVQFDCALVKLLNSQAKM